PKGVEQVTRTQLFLTMVLTQVKEGEYIGMPWLQVNGESTFTLATTLIYIPCGIVKHLQHGYNTVAGSIRTTDVSSGCTDVVYAQSNTTGTLRNLSRLFQRIVDPFNAVILHGQQEAGRHLWFRCCRIK